MQTKTTPRLQARMLKTITTGLTAVALLIGCARAAQDSLPPSKDGKAPTNLDELWGNYNPRLVNEPRGQALLLNLLWLDRRRSLP